MLGHDDVSDQRETIMRAEIVEDTNRQIASMGRAKQGPSAIATEGDEMQIAVTGEPSKILGHRSKERPTLWKPQRVGHPGCLLSITCR